MINRRQFLLASLSVALFPVSAVSKSDFNSEISWSEFQKNISDLADGYVRHFPEHNVQGHQLLAERGLNILKQLNFNSEEFNKAVVNSYETGNRYWLWQRLMKETNVNGGILNISNKQLVQLHDHPGATAMVKIISGEAEVWQFDNVSKDKASSDDMAELVRVSHKILRAGDTAVLTPERGNIHALRSVSDSCRMLDFFIPPYKRSQRSWFQPQLKNWFDKEKIVCKKIPQHEYLLA